MTIFLFRFAQLVAVAFLLRGFKIYLFSRLTPTPFVPFTVRKLNCLVGIMVTASHNPKEENGYKVSYYLFIFLIISDSENMPVYSDSEYSDEEIILQHDANFGNQINFGKYFGQIYDKKDSASFCWFSNRKKL